MVAKVAKNKAFDIFTGKDVIRDTVMLAADIKGQCLDLGITAENLSNTRGAALI